MAERYYISEYANWNPPHGGIGNHDIEVVLEREGYVPIRFPAAEGRGPLPKIQRVIHLVRTISTVPRGATVVFQHPTYAHMSAWAVKALNRGGRRLICMVSDIDGLKDRDEALLKKELVFFRRFRHFIVHNPAMLGWFRTQGIDGRFASLGLFDYLSKAVSQVREVSFEVTYAANLDHRPFVRKLKELNEPCPKLHFHVYGATEDPALFQGQNMTYQGSMAAYDMPANMKGSFGLIWEGDSLSTLQGGYSEYLRYISPHKLSMYIASGMPVVCHPDMAIAGFVRDKGIGLMVTDLRQLQGELEKIDGELYGRMRSNCLAMRDAVVEGRHLPDALDALLTGA